MMTKRSILDRVISIILVFTILMMLVSCSTEPPKPVLSDPNPQVVTENILVENEINEDILDEFISEEIYLQEIVVAEEKITELLLEEEQISEVLTCKTIYVSQDHIDDFAEHSQATHLFGDGIDIKSLLKKQSVGTGVIVTLTVLKLVGLPEPIGSIVSAAADSSLKFAQNGAAMGTLFGGLTGATDEIDETGRLTAIIGFAQATVGLIIATLSLIAIPSSGGSTTITLYKGIQLVIAGVLLASASYETIESGANLIKAFTSTDAADIDWDNIDWEKVGVSAAENAIEKRANGFMYGAIIGAVHGGMEGYENYEKFNAPYSDYKSRIDQTPKEGNGGTWKGERGESDFVLDEPMEYNYDGKTYTVKSITYKNGIPDFSICQRAQVKIPNMTNNRYNNFKQADEALAEIWTKTKFEGKTWTRSDVTSYRQNNELTWNEMNNMQSMQLLPSAPHAKFGHLGGVGEYNAGPGREGEIDFD